MASLTYLDSNTRRRFVHDKNGKLIYLSWNGLGPAYQLDEVTSEKLINIESYRYLVCSFKPPIIMLYLIIGFIVSLIMYLIHGIEKTDFDMEGAMITIMWTLYLFSCSIFLSKIFITLSKAKKLTKEEKKEVLLLRKSK
jgi:hypothetical protein